ncbi:hypothetical protein D8M30_08265 [Corynebacterium pseudodiphtheriticum]|nr:hypothetical protein D8M30_08265 [Corynebacterium pseudodiphtheriticum]
MVSTMTLLEVCFLPMLYFGRKYVSLHPKVVRVSSLSLLGWLCENSGTMLWHIRALRGGRMS